MNPHIKTMNMQARGFCARRFACHLVEYSKMCLETKRHARQRRCKLRRCKLHTYALGPDSEHWRAVQVEMIVHYKQRRRFRRGTLLGWLGESVHSEVEHLEAEPIKAGCNKPFTSHETIKQFYAETTTEEPLRGSTAVDFDS